MLGTNLEPAKGGHLHNALLIAFAVGAVAAFCLMLAIFGAPTEVFNGENIALDLLAMAFTLALAAAGIRFLIRAARPGQGGRRPLFLIGLFFFAMVSAGIGALVLAGSSAWGGMLFGPQWAACLVFIPLFALPPFASLVLALHTRAPTHPLLPLPFSHLLLGAVC